MDATRSGDRPPLRVVEYDAALRLGYFAHDELGRDAEQLAEQATPVLGGHRLVAGPVDDRARRRRDTEERLGLLEDVAVVDRAVRVGIPAQHHRITVADHVE